MLVVFKLLIWVISGFLIANLLKEVYTYFIWFKHYKRQGIPYEFTPITGIIYYLLVDLHPIFEKMETLRKFMNPLFSKGDSLAKFRQVANRTGADILAVNHPQAEPLLLIFNPDLILELVGQEEKQLKFPAQPVPTTMGLMLEGHTRAMKLRAIFSKFFHTENLVHSTPTISRIWQTRVSDIVQKFDSMPEEFPSEYEEKGKQTNDIIVYKLEKQNDGFKCVDFRAILIKIFSQIIDEELFGRDNGIEVHGMSIPEATSLMFHLTYNVAARNPINALLGGYPARLNLIKSMQTATNINKQI